MRKKVLLIGGGGTLGRYTAEELLGKGHTVDIICLEDVVSDNENLTFYNGRATLEYLEAFLQDKQYDGIVNFIHYPNVEEYPPVHKLLVAHTQHLIVLSSYRVYADEQHPITEEAPMLLDVSGDAEFVATEKYAISKAKLEKYLNSECKGQQWTVVRPVISFSDKRLDLVIYSKHTVLEMAAEGKEIPLPEVCRRVVAGIDWAGNSGKLIANLLFKEECFGQAYTVSTAQNRTWEEIAQYYSELVGAKFKWVSTEEFLEATNHFNYYALIYDRMFDRVVDNTKIKKATGLCEDDFKPIKEGLKTELKKLNK